MDEIKRLPSPWSYSMAVEAGDYVFLASHRGFGDDFITQFHDVLSRMKKTLAEFGLTLADLVLVDVRMKNIQDVRVYEKLFMDYFEKDKYPARTGSTTEFVDDDCLVGISGIAYRGGK